MLPNPPPFEYTGEGMESPTLTHMQLPNKDIHKEGCTQIHNRKNISRREQFKQIDEVHNIHTYINTHNLIVAASKSINKSKHIH